MRAADRIRFFSVAVLLPLAFALVLLLTVILGATLEREQTLALKLHHLQSEQNLCIALLDDSTTVLGQAIDRWRVELDPIFTAENDR